MAHTFTTLRHPLEKLLEAEYFLARLLRSNGLAFQFELNAFLSASRSISLLLQKAMARVPGFDAWYVQQQDRMRADAAMRFFLELRNISQKQGPVSYVGGSRLDGGWTYRFVGSPTAVPPELVGRDIGACCATHLIKIANVLLTCFHAFPQSSCPRLALTEEGMTRLGYTFADIEAALGLPPGYTEVAGIPPAEKLRILSRDFDQLDVAAIERIAGGELHGDGVALEIPSSSGSDLVDDIVLQLDPKRAGAENSGRNPREVFVRAVMGRINDEKES